MENVCEVLLLTFQCLVLMVNFKCIVDFKHIYIFMDSALGWTGENI